MRAEIAAGSAHNVAGVIDVRTGERFRCDAGAGELWLVTSPKVADLCRKAPPRRRPTTPPSSTWKPPPSPASPPCASIPFYAIKGVSDGFTDHLPDFNRFITPDGQFQLARFTLFAILRPWYWPALIRMGENSKKASQSIAESLLDFLDAIPMHEVTSENRMATQISNLKLRLDDKIPSTMRAVVYRGINDMRLETVPVPADRPRRTADQDRHLRHLRHRSEENPHGLALRAAHLRPRDGRNHRRRSAQGVTNFAVGDRVMVFHHVPCGECYYCRKQTPAQCPLYKKIGATAGFEPSGGGFAEYIRVMDLVVANRGVVRIPDGVPFEQAAFIEPVNTVLKGVKLLNLAADDTVLVIGQGPIGLMHAALAARTGARVLTSDLFPERHAIAARFGLNESHPRRH